MGKNPIFDVIFKIVSTQISEKLLRLRTTIFGQKMRIEEKVGKLDKIRNEFKYGIFAHCVVCALYRPLDNPTSITDDGTNVTCYLLDQVM